MPKKKSAENKPFEGKFNVKDFLSAIGQIETENQVSTEETLEILRCAIDKAVRDTLNPTKIEGLPDMETETTIDEAKGLIETYQVYEVREEDDIEDDLLQISVEDAKEHDKSLEVGDFYKEKIDYTTLDTSFFRKAIQNFHQKIVEASRIALLSKYKDKVGGLIAGVVEKTDNGFTTIAIDKVMTYLTPSNTIPGEKFMPGDTVKVYLNGVNTGEGKDKSTQLSITRTSDKFLEKLFELEIPDIADGTVKIKDIAREPGSRAKVAVYSDSKDVDPTGACIGNDGKRIKDICTQIYNEKIDVIKYIDNIYLYIAEALKPATVVGVLLNDETKKAVAVVRNEESKIAIGKKGVNVRLASRLVGYSIDIKEQDAAMNEHIPYINIDDIKRKAALELLDQAEENDENNEPVEEVYEETYETPLEPAHEEVVEETKIEEPVKEEVVEETKVEEPVKEEEPVEEEVPFEEEHVEIQGKAKVSLAELERQIEEDKKKQAPVSHKKHWKKDNKSEEKEDDTVEARPVAPVNALPIYTEEELKEIEEEEEEDYDSEDFSEFDDDSYYEDN